MSYLLEVDSIELEIGQRRILSDVYFKCETGFITGLLGRNGEGKSCLMNVVYGSMQATNKSVRINNVTIFSAFRHTDLLTYLPQFNFIPGHLSLHRIFADFSSSFASFEDHFPEFKGLGSFKIKNLSGGQRRLVEVYLIITSKAQFSMLDEPFSHIMPVHLEKIKALIQVEKTKKAFFITDHLYRQLVDFSDRLYVLKDGKTHLINTLDDIERLGYIKPDKA